MPDLIDLTMPISDHFRWKVERRTVAEHAKGDLFQVTWLGFAVHGFTHVDSPRHFFDNGKTTDDLTLEQTVGSVLEEKQHPPAESEKQDFDVAGVGGGPAGATAAIYSARKGLRTVVIAEQAGGQVAETKGIENLIALDYVEGKALAADLFQRLRKNDVAILEHRRVEEIVPGSIREIRLSGGEILTADRIILATGAKWRELGIPGEKEYLGRGVAFCPHCDGPYYKGKSVAVIGGGNSGVEAAIDLAGIVRDVVLIEFLDELKADRVLLDRLNGLENVRVVTGARSTAVVGDGERVTGLEYEDRASGAEKKINLDGVCFC